MHFRKLIKILKKTSKKSCATEEAERRVAKDQRGLGGKKKITHCIAGCKIKSS